MTPNSYLCCVFVLISSVLGFGQSSSTSSNRLGSLSKAVQAQNSTPWNIPSKNIGPTIMSGRVVDIDVNPQDPTKFYVAYASGGLWYTRNNGQSFTPIFDHEQSMTIGDIAVDWEHNEAIWVGTGEVNSSRSSYAGTGIYYSNDKGKTWKHKGLDESHHIGRIVIHPTQPNILYVAVLGHLYTTNPERGVFKSMDGGNTWQRSLFVNDSTGAVDLISNPKNPDILYAAMWQRDRKAWNFEESGVGSGIYMSTNAGKSWNKLSTKDSGFPSDRFTGRIGLDISRQNPNILYAIVDNQRPKLDAENKDSSSISTDDLRKMSPQQFLKTSDEKITTYLEKNRFPEKYSAASVKEMVKSAKIGPEALADYIEDANSALFSKNIEGAQIFRSTDGGKNWAKTHDAPMPNMYNTYGYYFGRITISPNDDKSIYVYGYEFIRSDDAGKTFVSLLGSNVHVDFHHLWINPKRNGHLICGNDGGVNISYDNGANWSKVNTPAVGQFYAVTVDNAKPFNVYGGLQDNGVWGGPSTYEYSTDWHQEGKYPYKSYLGGDGMQVSVDTTNGYLYAGYQFGNYFRINLASGQRKYITPTHNLGEPRFRWNWQTPILVSKHIPGIVYMGSNHLHRSTDFGATFPLKTKDLTNGGKLGDIPYGTLSAIDESSIFMGRLYTGSDDGRVHVSSDAGHSWTDITADWPKDLWVSRIIASNHSEDRVFVTLNGYRQDRFDPWLYLSEDAGQSWRRIGNNLPMESINVLREDPTNPQQLYVGTDHGLYVSFDMGTTFEPLSKDLPRVSVHDLAIQNRDQQLLVGTHGRSLYTIPLRHLRGLHDTLLSKSLHVFLPDRLAWNPNWGVTKNPWEKPSEPTIELAIYSKESGRFTGTLYSDKGDILSADMPLNLSKGLQYITLSPTIPKSYFPNFEKWVSANKDKDDKTGPIIPKPNNGKIYPMPGKYKVVVKSVSGNEKSEAPLEIKKRKE